MPIINAEHDAAFIGLQLNAPFVATQVSRLGTPTIMMVVSASKRSEWVNGILENSRYARFSISADGVIENFSGTLPKFRKCTAKSAADVAHKLNVYLSKVTLNH